MSPDVDPAFFVLDLHTEIYSGGGSSTYVYCTVCYRVIADLYVRSRVLSLHTVTLDDDLECPLDYELSLLRKVVCFGHAPVYNTSMLQAELRYCRCNL